MAFYQEFRYCRVPNAALLGNGICDNSQLYNTKACAFDGGDCRDFNKERPGCKAPDINRIGDGACDSPEYNNKACDYDGGDCEEFNKEYPGCVADNPRQIGSGHCNAAFDKAFLMTEECKWDGGDCADELQTAGINIGNDTAVEFAILVDELATLYPDCDMGHVPMLMGNGKCEHERLNTKDCGWEAGDCLEFNKKYPNCSASLLPKATADEGKLQYIGNGFCNGNTPDGAFDTPECGYDGGDCIAFRKEYPGCKAPRPDWLLNVKRCL